MDEIPPQDTHTHMAAAADLEKTLQQVVKDVVQILGYAGAMVTTHEQGDALPVRAIYIDPRLASKEQIHTWEKAVSDYAESPASIADPEIARVYVYHESHQDNLSVQAFKAGRPVRSDDLYDLFTPIAPLASRPVFGEIQQALGIRQVIAVPFFLETTVKEGQTEREIVGNLFAAKQGEISEKDALVLAAFGRQVAAAIDNERRRLQIEMAQRIVLEMQSDLREKEQILYQIARGIVSDLGYVGALVATFEPDHSLPARVLYLDPELATMDQVHSWEVEVSAFASNPVSITNPEIAQVLVDKDEYQENLSVRAYRAGEPVASSDLFDLMTPVAPPMSRPLIQSIQQTLGIQSVIAIPFYSETLVDGHLEREFVGNLVVATRSREFSGGEIGLLKALGQQAAVGIQNARLYRQVEERRKIAQVFGRMAFSATASAHALRNHVSAFRMYLHLLQVAPQEKLAQVLQSNDKVISRLDQALEILDNLHQPWRETPDARTQVNSSLTKALGKVVLDRIKLETEKGILVHESLAENLPAVNTSPHKLTEAFKVIIKNAVEAIQKTNKGGELRIESRRGRDGAIEVIISDSGVGIYPENLDMIYELRWSTKDEGMGFGLFWTKEYIEGIGGEIQVDSAWKEGSTFTIRLPAIAHEIES